MCAALIFLSFANSNVNRLSKLFPHHPAGKDKQLQSENKNFLNRHFQKK